MVFNPVCVLGDELMFEGSFSPKLMPIYQVLSDVWTAQINFGFFSLLFSEPKDLRESTLYKGVRDYEKLFENEPIKVLLKSSGISGDLRGFVLDATLTSRSFTKILSSQKDFIKVRLFTKASGCDNDSHKGSVSTANASADELIKILRQTKYTSELPFQCDFEVTQVLLGDMASLLVSSRAMELMFNNFSQPLTSNVFSFRKSKASFESWYSQKNNVYCKANTQGEGTLKVSLFIDSTLLIESNTSISFDFIEEDEGEEDKSMNRSFSMKLNQKSPKMELDAISEREAYSAVKDLISLIDGYRQTLVTSYALAPAKRAAFAKIKLDSIKSPLRKAHDDFILKVDAFSPLKRIIVLNKINRAIEELSLAELKLEVIESPEDGISSLDIQHHLR
jgi:hypothetical protein